MKSRYFLNILVTVLAVFVLALSNRIKVCAEDTSWQTDYAYIVNESTHEILLSICLGFRIPMHILMGRQELITLQPAGKKFRIFRIRVGSMSLLHGIACN